jgi:hypothetical protein
MALHIHECKHKHCFQKSFQNLPFCPAIIVSNWENGYYRVLFPSESAVNEFPVAAIVVPPANESINPTNSGGKNNNNYNEKVADAATSEVVGVAVDEFEDAKQLMMFAQPEPETMDVVKTER